ncbi:MAG: DUF4301 family protein [Bacteroidales bacterium]|nr:DUF4301 family protein [Bacteroidales bacterium]
MFTEQDYAAIKAHQIDTTSLNNQCSMVLCDCPRVKLVSPIFPYDGLYVVNESSIKRILNAYAKNVGDKKIVKFVPASGAATRMFKDIYVYLQGETVPKSVQEVIDNLDKFAFYPALRQCLQDHGLDIDAKETEDRNIYKRIFTYLLEKEGLNYAHLPKGLLEFHAYPHQEVRTAVEEHLVEAALYAVSNDKVAHVHFTISPEHEQLFKNFVDQKKEKYEQMLNVTYDITYSFQHPSTDTLAFDEDNKPFRDENGNLVFRPGGHGSLIKNLNDIDADIIFIKNIDNVTLDMYKGDTVKYKKVLLSVLLDLQKSVAFCMRILNSSNPSFEALKACEFMVTRRFYIVLPHYYYEMDNPNKIQYLYRLLNKPIRVCGVVKQEGEPGGGPFWTEDNNGVRSLQIVETSEMNFEDSTQQSVMMRSSYFNPVDIVCSIKNYKGEKFRLSDFVDYQRYFVSSKSVNGKTIKAIENPGLWNGAMSNWLTVFVATPLSTFSPVKTINDLLRKEHCK